MLEETKVMLEATKDTTEILTRGILTLTRRAARESNSDDDYCRRNLTPTTPGNLTPTPTRRAGNPSICYFYPANRYDQEKLTMWDAPPMCIGYWVSPPPDTHIKEFIALEKSWKHSDRTCRVMGYSYHLATGCFSKMDSNSI